MWKKSYFIVTKEVTKEQVWQVFADVNHWHTWDNSVEYAHLLGEFQQGNFFELKPKNAPKSKVLIYKVIENKNFTAMMTLPFGKIYYEHLLEETTNGLKVSGTITVKGFLSFLWIKLIAQKMAKSLPQDIENQIKQAKKYER